MPNTLKKEAVKNLRSKLSKAKSLILTDFTGLNANQSNDLRKKIANSGGEVLIAKNSLIKIALKEEKIESKELNNDFEGQTATIIAYEDAVAPIKVLFEFIRTLEVPKIKSALIDGVYNTKQMVEVLSKLPSRTELLTKVVTSLKSPLAGIVNVLSGPQRKLVYVMQAISEKKKEVS